MYNGCSPEIKWLPRISVGTRLIYMVATGLDRPVTVECPPLATLLTHQVLRLNEFVSNRILLRGPSPRHCLSFYAIANHSRDPSWTFYSHGDVGPIWAQFSRLHLPIPGRLRTRGAGLFGRVANLT